MSIKLKPFVKWVGGKTQFLPVIRLLLPANFNRFIEPFVGGGSVFLSLQHDQLIINDFNQELMIAYKVVKNTPQVLIDLLQGLEKNRTDKRRLNYFPSLGEPKPNVFTERF